MYLTCQLYNKRQTERRRKHYAETRALLSFGLLPSYCLNTLLRNNTAARIFELISLCISLTTEKKNKVVPDTFILCPL